MAGKHDRAWDVYKGCENTLRKRGKRKKVTMRYKDALDLTKCGGHELGSPVPACAARFGIVIFVWT